LVEKSRTGGKEDPFEIADSGDEQFEQEEEEEKEESEDVFDDAANSSPEDDDMSEIDEDWGMDGDGYGVGSLESLNGTSSSHHAVNAKKARHDLRALKAAGFKVGVMGRGDSRRIYSGAVYISAAVRISKLGLSDDTLVAWALKDKEHYLILVMYYPSGYRSLEELRNAPSTTRKELLSWRVATSEGYTAKVEDAAALFKSDKENTSKFSTQLKSTFISIPLEDLLNNNFLVIVEYRLEFGFNATSAEHYLKANLGQTSLVASYEDSYDFSTKHKEFVTGKTRLLRGDELGEGKEVASLSLPLIAAQFFLRRK
jgi:ubiquitin-conjugating enzyme E2 Q